MPASEMLLRPLALGAIVFTVFVYAKPSSPAQEAVTTDPKELAELCAYSNSSIKYHAYPMGDKVRCYSVRNRPEKGKPSNCPPRPSGKGVHKSGNIFAVIEDKGQLQFVTRNLDATNAVLYIKVNRVREPKELRWTNGDPAVNDLNVHLAPMDDDLLYMIVVGKDLLIYDPEYRSYSHYGIKEGDIHEDGLAKTMKVLCSFDVESPVTATPGKEGTPPPPPPHPGFWQIYGTYIIIGLIALVGVILVVTLVIVLYRRFCRRRRFKRKKKKHGDSSESATTTSESTESEE